MIEDKTVEHKPNGIREAAHPNPNTQNHNSVNIRSLQVTFGTERVINSLDLQVAPGEFVAMVGKSGCGKTTTLNVVAGLVEPCGGVVEVFGKSPHLVTHRTAYMFARDSLLPWRDAQRNVELILEMRDVPPQERRERARAMLNTVGLPHAGAKFPRQLSQGMRQRVALARTWVTEPDLLLMDEPFSALDAQTATAIRQQFLSMWEHKRNSVLFVTHNLKESLLLSDRVILLKSGRIVREVRVPFERPRHAEDIEHDMEFRRLQAELSESL